MICYKCLKTVEPEKCIYGLHKACFREWFQLQNLSEFEKIRAKASSFENNLSSIASPSSANMLSIIFFYFVYGRARVLPPHKQ